MDSVPHQPETPAVPSPRPPRARRGRWVAVAAAVVALVAVLWAARRGTGAPPRPGPPAGARAPAVPVVAAPVVRRDVPVTAEGLGNVVAYRTVVVKPQVDGRLEQVLFREGQPVRAGQVLAQIDPRPFESQLHQVEGARARDAAQLAAARVNLERYRTLARQSLIGQQQADDQAALVGQLEGTVRLDDAAIESAKLNLGYTRITSPIDGVTGIRIVDPGNVVHASDPNGIVIVTQIDPIAVIFTLPQDQLPAVAGAMQRGPLRVDVLGRDGTTLLGSGRLELIDNQINAATATMRLKAVLPNPRRLLWPNQFVNARLHLSELRGVLVVPGTAIQRGPAGVFTYVIGADSTVAPRPVEIAATAGDLTVVGRGLAEGDQVVVDGQNQLRPGAKVIAHEAPAGGGAPRGGPPAGGGGGRGAPPGAGAEARGR